MADHAQTRGRARVPDRRRPSPRTGGCCSPTASAPRTRSSRSARRARAAGVYVLAEAAGPRVHAAGPRAPRRTRPTPTSSPGSPTPAARPTRRAAGVRGSGEPAADLEAVVATERGELRFRPGSGDDRPARRGLGRRGRAAARSRSTSATAASSATRYPGRARRGSGRRCARPTPATSSSRSLPAASASTGAARATSAAAATARCTPRTRSCPLLGGRTRPTASRPGASSGRCATSPTLVCDALRASPPRSGSAAEVEERTR